MGRRTEAPLRPPFEVENAERLRHPGEDVEERVIFFGGDFRGDIMLNIDHETCVTEQ